jgi:hypothetical protein
VRHKGIGRWWASVPIDKWPDRRAVEEVVKQYWNKDYGDRRQEIVFIGLRDAMDEAAIRSRLDTCLFDDYLTSPDYFQNLKDPFPKWFEDVGDMKF